MKGAAAADAGKAAASSAASAASDAAAPPGLVWVSDVGAGDPPHPPR